MIFDLIIVKSNAYNSWAIRSGGLPNFVLSDGATFSLASKDIQLIEQFGHFLKSYFHKEIIKSFHTQGIKPQVRGRLGYRLSRWFED